MKSLPPNEKHQKIMREFKEVLFKHKDDLTPSEMLAVAAQLVGQVLALQNQTLMTPAAAMSIVAANIESGNQAVIDGLLNEPTAGSA